MISVIRADVRHLGPLPDDEHHHQRESITAQIEDHRKKSILAESRSDCDAKDLHDFHAQLLLKDLSEIPESERQKKAADQMYELAEQTVEQLFDPEIADNPVFESPKMMHDSAV